MPPKGGRRKSGTTSQSQNPPDEGPPGGNVKWSGGLDIALAYMMKDQFCSWWRKFPKIDVAKDWEKALGINDPSGIKMKNPGIGKAQKGISSI